MSHTPLLMLINAYFHQMSSYIYTSMKEDILIKHEKSWCVYRDYSSVGHIHKHTVNRYSGVAVKGGISMQLRASESRYFVFFSNTYYITH